MKHISSALGTAGIKVSSDDVMPVGGVLQRDLVAFIQEAYNFNVFPSIGSGVPAGANPVLAFQSGELDGSEGKIPINAIVIFPDGYTATAQNTELADFVLKDLLSRLEHKFGHRFTAARPKHQLVAAEVVELDDKFVSKTEAFATIQAVLNATFKGTSQSYQMKRLAFGFDPSITNVPNLQSLSVDGVLPTDFVIERRANESLDKNRFFCMAPLSSMELRGLIERIEKTAIK